MAPEVFRKGHDNFVQRATSKAVEFALCHYNGLKITIDPNAPREGRMITLVNHGSLFDVAALLVADPYRPRTAPILKSSLAHIPVISNILNLWHPIYVKRDGSDALSARKQIRNALFKENRGVCIAAEGARSRSGRMESLHPALVAMVLECAFHGVPVIACGVDAYDVLPPGRKIPRRNKITVNIGGPLDLGRWAKRRVSKEVLFEAGKYIQDSIAALLPPEKRPAPETSPLRNLKEENLGNK